MKKTKIALVQIEAIVGKKRLNLKKIEHYIKEAYKNKVDIICFPEAAVDGYSKEVRPSKDEEASELQEIFNTWAMDYSITILVGFIEGNSTDKPYITQLIATPDGKIDFYRKSHLGKSEIEHFSCGDELPVFKTPTAIIGIQLCWETHFPEISRVMALKGADIIFTPFASPVKKGDRRDIWLKYLPARAYDNTVFIAACNLIGINGKGTTFGGGLLALDPKGNLIEEDFGGKESILFVELNPELINNIRNQDNNIMKSRYYMNHRRPELYREIVK